MKVPFFPYSDLYLEDEIAYQDIFKDVSSRGAFILQKELEEFEELLCKYTNSNYVLGMGNATDALEIGLIAGGLEKGSEVIICSHTMIATASAVVVAGATAVPIDCGIDHMMDASKIEAAITDKTRAIMPTQLNGRVCDMDLIFEIADKHKLQVYEDSAQALGAKYKNKTAGTFGIAGCISFYPAKTMGCFGDGGALLVQDEEVYKKAKLMRDHGRNEENKIVMWGRNSRLDNIQAAIMLYKMKSYDKWIARRRDIASMYNDGLSCIDNIVLPPPPSEEVNYDIYQNYEIQADNRDELKTYLHNNDVGSLQQWSGIAVHHCKELGFNQDLKVTDDIFSRILMIPMNHLLTNEQVEHVINTIKKFYNK
tara:strand:- start:416 stop:1516 length:1101 start_codon:yes stop_codon:yes gene_type:complete